MAKAQSLTPENNGIENAAKEGEIQPQRPFDKWVQALKGEAEITANFTDSSEIAANVMEQMLQAETLDAAIEVQDSGLPSAKETMIDVEHRIHEFEVVPSKRTFEGNTAQIGVYFRVHATRLDNGQDVVYSVGAFNPMMIMHTARRLGELPLDAVIRGKDTDNGQLLLMYRVSKRAVQV